VTSAVNVLKFAPRVFFTIYGMTIMVEPLLVSKGIDYGLCEEVYDRGALEYTPHKIGLCLRGFTRNLWEKRRVGKLKRPRPPLNL